jgi:hypothetical protein
MSIARRCLELASLFEAELLTELMLRHWKHPFADDAEFRNDLLEASTQALQHAANGEQLLDSVAPENINLVAALWYAEWVAMPTSESEDAVEIHQPREKWLEVVRRAVPSCFTDDIM